MFVAVNVWFQLVFISTIRGLRFLRVTFFFFSCVVHKHTAITFVNTRKHGIATPRRSSLKFLCSLSFMFRVTTDSEPT